ncbi:hypothetical protein [Phenylobacterium sp.]|uniref:hypothetical protein n=1 Tax=Phenylobacterium sp. TaxID=1871053 RepID=UPI0025E76EC9|nr:hypothetical protein [Phenylobacterium sp.]MBX3483072.1 hypothetical protein [Phenylobacterium sp.]
MAREPHIVIGNLSAPRILALYLLGIGLIALMLWLALVRGYYRPRYDELQFGVGYFLPVILGIGCFLTLGLPLVARVLFGGARGLEIRDGRLVEVGWSVGLGDIERIETGPEGLFEGLPRSLEIMLKPDAPRSGRESSVGLACFWYATSPRVMAERLARCGLSVDWRI